jgi:hypothetical protein
MARVLAHATRLFLKQRKESIPKLTTDIENHTSRDAAPETDIDETHLPFHNIRLRMTNRILCSFFHLVFSCLDATPTIKYYSILKIFCNINF